MTDQEEIKNWIESTGHLFAEVSLTKKSSSGYELDGSILIRDKYGEGTIELPFERRITVSPRDIDTIVGRKHRYGLKLIVADYVTPKAKEELWKERVGTVDRTGEFRFIDKNVLIIISPCPEKTKERYPAAFTKNGLLFIYRAIREPGLLNYHYRDITELTGITKSTLGRIFHSLQQQGFINNEDGWHKSFQNKDVLFQKWIKYCDEQLSKPPNRNDDPRVIEELKRARAELTTE